MTIDKTSTCLLEQDVRVYYEGEYSFRSRPNSGKGRVEAACLRKGCTTRCQARRMN